MSDINIRAANANDLPAVQSLLKSAALPLDGVADFFPANYAVGQVGEQVVAAIGVERYGEDGLLRSAVVADSQRGTGLGSRLANERLEWCGRHQIRNLYLLTTTAAPFFEKLGFERGERTEVPSEVQRAPEFTSICPSTAVVMRRACP